MYCKLGPYICRMTSFITYVKESKGDVSLLGRSTLTLFIFNHGPLDYCVVLRPNNNSTILYCVFIKKC